MLKTVSKLVDASQIKTPITLPGDVTLSTGNLVIGTAGKGIDFSANPNAPGMTSELFNDYEIGTWTPTLNDVTVSYTTQSGTYTKIGRLVYADCLLNVSSLDNTDLSSVAIGGLPFVQAAGNRGLVSAANFFGQTPLMTTNIRSMTGIDIVSSVAYLLDASQTSFLQYSTTCNASGRVYLSFVYQAA
jgi:hypothetical protein